MIETITAVNTAVNNFIWGVPAMVCIIGVGLLLSVRTGFLQIRKFPYTIKTTIGRMFRKKDASDGAITPFQAVCTALAGTVGTGNIAGVTGAIFAGGPGAVFWMWFAAFFGMFTKFAEIVLALKYRQVDENGVHYGGPMYYIEKGLGMKWLAVLFSLVAGFACFGIGNISQSSEIAGAMEGLFGMSGLTTGVLLAVVVGIVVLGGVQRIGRVTSYMVPFMAIFYIGAGLAVILLRIDQVPAALASIFTNAYSFEWGAAYSAMPLWWLCAKDLPGACSPTRRALAPPPWPMRPPRPRSRWSRGCGACLRCSSTPSSSAR